MSNIERTPSDQDQSSIDQGRGRELTQMCAELELPYDVPTGCGAKAIAIMSLLRLQNVRRDSIGVAMAYVPDLSPEGMESAEAEHNAMRFRQSPYTFAERLKTGIGAVDIDAKTVEWSGVRLVEAEVDGSAYVTVERLVPENTLEGRRDDPLPDLLNSNRWVLPPPGEDTYMGNHAAARLGNMIIDPSYEKDRPLSMEEWRECQGFSDAVLLSSTITNAATPLRAHAELMPREQRRRYDMLLEKNGVTHEEVQHDLPAYQAVMKEFFNLESSVPWEDNPTDIIEQRVSRLKAKAILAGDGNYELPEDGEPCESQLNFRIGRLGLAMVYQRWLEQTGAILEARLSTTTVD